MNEISRKRGAEKSTQFVINHLRQAVKNIKAEAAFKVTRRVKLAHYTSLETLYSILDSARKQRDASTPGDAGLRLYETKTLNDPAEGKHLKDFLAKRYSWIKFASDDADNAFTCSFVSNIRESDMYKKIGDNLVHWKAYGEDGLGCSICYEPNQDELLHYSHVVYGDQCEQKILEHLHYVLELGNEFCNTFDKKRDKKYFATRFWNEFDEVKFLYKSSHYEHESECRVLIPLDEPGEKHYHFNPMSLNLREYVIRETLSTSRILSTGSKVFIGPRVQNKDSLIQNFEKFAKEADVGAKFLPSSIPYRKI